MDWMPKEKLKTTGLRNYDGCTRILGISHDPRYDAERYCFAGHFNPTGISRRPISPEKETQ